MPVAGRSLLALRPRATAGIKKGTRIRVFEKDDQIILNPLTPQFIRQKIEELYGSVKGGPSLTKELEAERARDKEKEESRIERRSRLR